MLLILVPIEVAGQGLQVLARLLSAQRRLAVLTVRLSVDTSDSLVSWLLLGYKEVKDAKS